MDVRRAEKARTQFEQTLRADEHVPKEAVTVAASLDGRARPDEPSASQARRASAGQSCGCRPVVDQIREPPRAVAGLLRGGVCGQAARQQRALITPLASPPCSAAPPAAARPVQFPRARAKELVMTGEIFNLPVGPSAMLRRASSAPQAACRETVRLRGELSHQSGGGAGGLGRRVDDRATENLLGAASGFSAAASAVTRRASRER
jgi:hypothetical protein